MCLLVLVACSTGSLVSYTTIQNVSLPAGNNYTGCHHHCWQLYNTSDMSSTVGAMFQNELILSVSFSAIVLLIAQLSGLLIIILYINWNWRCGGWLQVRRYVGSVAVGNYQSTKSWSVTHQMYIWIVSLHYIYTKAYFLALDTEGFITTVHM